MLWLSGGGHHYPGLVRTLARDQCALPGVALQVSVNLRFEALWLQLCLLEPGRVFQPCFSGKTKGLDHSAPSSPSVKRNTFLVCSAERGRFLSKFLELRKEVQRLFVSLHLTF